MVKPYPVASVCTCLSRAERLDIFRSHAAERSFKSRDHVRELMLT